MTHDNDRLTAWGSAWMDALLSAVRAAPAEYWLKPEETAEQYVGRVWAKMMQSIRDNGIGAVCFSDTMKHANRALGLKPTQKAFREFTCEGV